MNLQKPTDVWSNEQATYSRENMPTNATKIQPKRNQAKSANAAESWLNYDGSCKNIEELKILGKTWRPADWEGYLTNTETYQREDYLEDGRSVEKLSNDDYAAAFVEILDQEEYPAFKDNLQRIVASLNPRQRQVIQLRYSENKTQTQMADIVGISRQGIQKLLRSSQKKIEKRLRILAAKKSCIEVMEGATKFQQKRSQ